MNKKTIIAVLAVTTILTGCSAKEQADESAYLTAARQDAIVELEMKSDKEIIELGRYTCELFDNKVTPNDVIVKVVERGNLQTGEAIDSVITNALLGLCPEYADVLNYG